jgi:hypothetical protein
MHGPTRIFWANLTPFLLQGVSVAAFVLVLALEAATA